MIYHSATRKGIATTFQVLSRGGSQGSRITSWITKLEDFKLRLICTSAINQDRLPNRDSHCSEYIKNDGSFSIVPLPPTAPSTLFVFIFSFFLQARCLQYLTYLVLPPFFYTLSLWFNLLSHSSPQPLFLFRLPLSFRSELLRLLINLR